jgi:hypothetical protein
MEGRCPQVELRAPSLCPAVRSRLNAGWTSDRLGRSRIGGQYFQECFVLAVYVHRGGGQPIH